MTIDTEFMAQVQIQLDTRVHSAYILIILQSEDLRPSHRYLQDLCDNKTVKLLFSPGIWGLSSPKPTPSPLHPSLQPSNSSIPHSSTTRASEWILGCRAPFGVSRRPWVHLCSLQGKSTLIFGVHPVVFPRETRKTQALYLFRVSPISQGWNLWQVPNTQSCSARRNTMDLPPAEFAELT